MNPSPYAENHQVGFAESGYIAVHPDDPDLVFAGATGSAPGGGGPIWAYDHRSRQSRLVTVSPEYFFGEGLTGLTHRFPWTFPIAFSPHDSNVLYTTGECVFRSTDLGTSYEAISPDLTRNDPEKLQAAGGPIQLDTSGAETYCTLSVLVESPHEAGTIWVGSDDGLVHITRDGGASWAEITPPAVPEWSYISSIEVSPHDPATTYLAATRYKLDDLVPLVFKTSDYGVTWTDIASDLPADATARVLREDRTRSGLLYMGSERDLFVTFDDGASWQSLRRNMPAVPVYDLRAHGDDLVAATHGRGFWILDDLAPLRELTSETASATAHLFTPEAAYRYGAPLRATVVEGGKNYSGGGVAGSTFYDRKDADGQTQRIFLDAGTNPPNGATLYYHLAEQPAEAIELAFLDEQGAAVRTFRSDPEAQPSPDPEPSDGPKDPKLLTAQGLNRFVWDLRCERATSVPGDRTTEQAVLGPVAPPGRYEVRLTVAGESQTRSFEVLADPNVRATREEFDAQFEFLIRIRDRLSATNAPPRPPRACRVASAIADRSPQYPPQAAAVAPRRTRRADGLQRLVPQPALRQLAGREILHHDVVRGNEAANDIRPVGCVEVEGHAALVGVQVQEARSTLPVTLVAEAGTGAACAVALGGLDLEHAGAAVREQPGRVGAGNIGGQIQDPHAIECNHQTLLNLACDDCFAHRA